MNTTPIFHSLHEALPLIQSWKNLGHSIGFTNGCFDIFHKGHVDYLTESATLTDKLVVGLNSDSSVRKIKGKNRPIQSEESRAAVLSALKGIDAVMIFEEETPLKIIESINPDIIIKGGDYKEQEMIGREHVLIYGGRCVIISFTKGFSTSEIIEKIKNI